MEDSIPIRNKLSQSLAEYQDRQAGSGRAIKQIDAKIDELSSNVDEIQKNVKIQNQEWLSREQAANHLGISLDTFDRIRQRGEIRDHQVSGTASIRFKRSDVDNLLG